MFGEKHINSCEHCLVGWKNFKNLSEDELKLVDANRYEATFRPGEIIIKQGSPATSAVFLASGIAKVYMEGLDGKNFILDIVKPTSLILGPGVYVYNSHSFSVSALTFSRACFVSIDIISTLVRNNPVFAYGMLEDLSIKSYNAHAKLVSISQKKMPGRIAEALLLFSDKVFEKDEFDILMSRNELGEMTNMAKESVVRVLKELETLGVIETSCAKITILDKEKLRIISDRG